MPEYLALLHYHEKQAADQAPPPTPDEMDAAFARIERAGIGVVH